MQGVLIRQFDTNHKACSTYGRFSVQRQSVPRSPAKKNSLKAYNLQFSVQVVRAAMPAGGEHMAVQPGRPGATEIGGEPESIPLLSICDALCSFNQVNVQVHIEPQIGCVVATNILLWQLWV